MVYNKDINKNQMKTIIDEFLKRPIAYQPIVAKAFKSVKLGILWSQLYYWHDKSNDPECWVYKTIEQIYDETGLSKKEQRTARDLGIELGILEEKIAGYPKKVHFKINIEKAQELIQRFIESQNKGQQQIVEVIKKTKNYSSISYLKEIPLEDIKEISDIYSVDAKFIKDRANDVIDYCEAKGKKYSNYKAALRNFVKIHLDRHPEIKNALAEDRRRKQEVEKIEKPDRIRTPEEQARVNKKLNDVREQLKNKFSLK